MKTGTIALIIGPLFLLAAGCAGQQSTGASESDRTCISVRSINGFNPLSDRELLVTATVSDHYLFTVVGICPGLRSADSIAINDPTSRICNDSFGSVTYADRVHGEQTCRVEQIERVTGIEEARDIVEIRREARSR